MRTIERSSKFKKDFKRIAKSLGSQTLDKLLTDALELLLNDRPLPTSYKDHELTNAAGIRDCHLKPDLVLLYERPDDHTLRLIRLGSHSDLF
jgi:mRNA interferase YafQ